MPRANRGSSSRTLLLLLGLATGACAGDAESAQTTDANGELQPPTLRGSDLCSEDRDCPETLCIEVLEPVDLSVQCGKQTARVLRKFHRCETARDLCDSPFDCRRGELCAQIQGANACTAYTPYPCSDYPF